MQIREEMSRLLMIKSKQSAKKNSVKKIKIMKNFISFRNSKVSGCMETLLKKMVQMTF